jgi:AcrR family transcriptional regulator
MPSDNRANILHHALRLFAARGYDAVSVQEIVEAAGVTKPTLYHYFKNKRGLLDALLNTYHTRLFSAVNQAAAFENNLVMNLRGIMQAYFSFALENPTFYQYQLSMQYAPPDSAAYQAIANRNQQIFEVIHTLFEQALPHMQGRHRRYAVSFIGTIDTYITLVLNGHTRFNDQLVYDAVHQFMHGIYS